jgi:hypothetical protein
MPLKITRSIPDAPASTVTLIVNDRFDADREVAVRITGPDSTAHMYLNEASLIALRAHISEMLGGRDAPVAEYDIEAD